MASRALDKLANNLDNFRFEEVAQKMMFKNIVKCVNEAKNMKSMSRLLHEMAEKGFSEANPYDPAVKLISLVNIGGVVKTSATVVGVPRDVLEANRAKHGIVPSTLFHRLAIAEALRKAKKERSAGGSGEMMLVAAEKKEI